MSALGNLYNIGDEIQGALLSVIISRRTVLSLEGLQEYYEAIRGDVERSTFNFENEQSNIKSDDTRQRKKRPGW
jgi:hypothetical protein